MVRFGRRREGNIRIWTLVRSGICGSIAIVFICLLALSAGSKEAKAQSSSLFCLPGQVLKNGFCVNPYPGSTVLPCPQGWGPISFGAGLACAGFSSSAQFSQNLATISQSLTQVSSTAALQALEERRNQEIGCPSGLTWKNGRCERTTSSAALGYAGENSSISSKNPLAAKGTAAVANGPSPAVWTQVFGDYERRNSSSSTIVGNPGLQMSQNVQSNSISRSFGFIVGSDLTIRSIGFSDDALMLGVMGGYMRSHSTQSSQQSGTVSFSGSQTLGTVEGPSAGVYATYIRGKFSVGLTSKADFLSIGQTFSDFSGGVFANSGSSSINLTNYNTSGNVNYKIMLGNTVFIEPTIGLSYTQSVYGGGAAALGLANGTDTRLQGGARIGGTGTWGAVTVEPSVTLLAYSDVSITGGTSTANGFSSTSPTDQGLVRGQVLPSLNFELGQGWSVSTGGDIRFGQGMFGAGAKAGARYQW